VTPETRQALLDKVALLPTGPGVYTFLDAKGKVIYVGKAKNLRNRVRSYLREDHDDGRRFYAHLVSSMVDLSFVATSSEKEALLLENTLIKRHRPRWNIKLNDDKSFLQLQVTTDRAWPQARLIRTTAREKRGAIFGPYSSARAVRETLRHLKRFFPLRTCSDAELRQRTRPCIEHEMGRCLAPCVGKVSEVEYASVVEDVVLFLKGKDDTLLPRLRDKMQEHARALRFEQAARVRDQIRAIERTLEVQRVAREGARDQDVFGLAAHDGLVVVLLLPVREGQVTEPRTYELRTDLPPSEALNAFLGQFYAAERYVPHEVLLPFEVEDRALLEEVLSERRGSRVEVKVAVRGDRRGLVELAAKNAALALETGEEKRLATRELLEGLEERLRLSRLPWVIECFDVSTIQGSFTVASKVRFVEGTPDPGGYRTYRVRSIEGQDDFAAMEEVVERRLRSGLEKGDLPDLIVVDGGPAQLARALEAAHRAGLPPQRTAIVGLAKARYVPRGDDLGEQGAPLAEQTDDEEGALRAFERVYLPGRPDPVVLEPASLECRFLARVRDAAHRAAIRFHRELRRKSALRSGLEEVPGVGTKRRRELLARFGSLRRIKEATYEELCAVLPAHVARDVRAFFDAPPGEPSGTDPAGAEPGADAGRPPSPR
jgi:excinuclease ABC subunit C